MDNNSLKIISHTAVPVIKLTTQGYMPGLAPPTSFAAGSGINHSSNAGNLGGSGHGDVGRVDGNAGSIRRGRDSASPTPHHSSSGHPTPCNTPIRTTNSLPAASMALLIPPTVELPPRPPLSRGACSESAIGEGVVKRGSPRCHSPLEGRESAVSSDRAGSRDAEGDAVHASDVSLKAAQGVIPASSDLSPTSGRLLESEVDVGHEHAKEDEAGALLGPSPRLPASRVQTGQQQQQQQQKDKEKERQEESAEAMGVHAAISEEFAANGKRDAGGERESILNANTSTSATAATAALSQQQQQQPQSQVSPPQNSQPSPLSTPSTGTDGQTRSMARTVHASSGGAEVMIPLGQKSSKVEKDDQAKQAPPQQETREAPHEKGERGGENGVPVTGMAIGEKSDVDGQLGDKGAAADDGGEGFVGVGDDGGVSGGRGSGVAGATGGAGGWIDQVGLPRVLVDVSFEGQGHNGQAANQLVKDLVDGLPALRPLALLLKQVRWYTFRAWDRRHLADDAQRSARLRVSPVEQ